MRYWRFTLNQLLSVALISLCWFSGVSFADDYQIKGEDVRVDTSEFSGLLNATDNTVQKALEKIDSTASSGLSDAPADGTTYGRKDGSWSVVGTSTLPDKIEFIIDSNGSTIAAGASGTKTVPFACTVTGWQITSSASGSAVVDVLRDTYAGFPSGFATIAGSEKPTLSSAVKNQDTSLSTWTTSLAAGDRIRVSVDSANITGVVVVTIFLTRT